MQGESQDKNENNSLEILDKFWKNDKEEEKLIDSDLPNESGEILNDLKNIERKQFVQTQKIIFDTKIET